MTTAFQDPFYLRYKYKPDCELHRTTEATPQATQPRATQKPHHRPKTERSKVSTEKDKVKSKPTSTNQDELRSDAASSTCSGILLALTLSVVLLHKRWLHREDTLWRHSGAISPQSGQPYCISVMKYSYLVKAWQVRDKYYRLGNCSTVQSWTELHGLEELHGLGNVAKEEKRWRVSAGNIHCTDQTLSDIQIYGNTSYELNKYTLPKYVYNANKMKWILIRGLIYK